MEGRMEVRQTDPGRFDKVAGTNQDKQPAKLLTENSMLFNNNRCSRDRLGSVAGTSGQSGGTDNTSWRVEWNMDLEVLQLAGSSSSVDGPENSSRILSTRNCDDDKYRQHGDRMVHQKMAGEEGDAADNQKNKDVRIREGHTPDDTTYPRDEQQGGRLTQQDVNGG
ncbi:MAG: hypothetical protein EZS28_021077 [Streblomastix strix]|uniref:Uncharacterized protein n=1 Tax=Streblomastix strix TaxID=222440 RepID=A0A5J4VLC9_9EUKA|nr:MAG: hypothetical protein EZS28_021077 [Streblomastix strix]